MSTAPHSAEEEPWGEEDPEAPQDIDLDRDDHEDDTLPCPECGHRVSDLAERCPHCQAWIIPGAEPRHGPNWWVFAAVLLLALSLVWWSLY